MLRFDLLDIRAMEQTATLRMATPTWMATAASWGTGSSDHAVEGSMTL
jgi:hypothetical protein